MNSEGSINIQDFDICYLVNWVGKMGSSLSLGIIIYITLIAVVADVFDWF